MASHSETIVCNYSEPIRWGLCHQVFRYNGYEVIYFDEVEICGTIAIGINQVKIWLLLAPSTVVVSCSGIMESWCKKQVDKFVGLLDQELSKFSSDREKQYLKEANDKVPSLGYEIPKILPPPTGIGNQNPFYHVASALVFTAMSIFLYSALWTVGYIWSVVVAIIYAMGLGFVITTTAKFGHYSNWPLLKVSLVVSALMFGSATFYLSWTYRFFETMNQSHFIFLIFFYFGVPSIAGLGVLIEGQRKSQKEGVPTEVLTFVRHLELKGTSEIGVRSELSKRGWILNQDQERVLTALAAYHQLQNQAKILAKKQ